MTKWKTYQTEDGHTKADCPQCEASEHPHILDEYGKCEICYYEEKKGRTMKYKEFKMKHDNLEREVLDFLRTLIKESKITSETVNTPCIKVNVFDYVELAVIHGDLTFLDNDGLQYGLYSECALEDLIDIISKI